MSNDNFIDIPDYTSNILITTNNISDVQKNNKEPLNKTNNYYDINQNDDSKNQIQTELSTMINSPSNMTEEEILDKDIDINQEDKLGIPIIKEEEKKFSSSLLYGNSINEIKPKHIGKLFAFFYVNEKPLILIGPDCKKTFIFKNYFYFYIFR
jgi:hypothetical protein